MTLRFYNVDKRCDCKKTLSPSRAIKPIRGVNLRFLSLQPDISFLCEVTMVRRAVCLFTSEISLVLIAPTH